MNEARNKGLIAAAVMSGLLLGCGTREVPAPPAPQAQLVTPALGVEPGPVRIQPPAKISERYSPLGLTPVRSTREAPVSTFGIDVDTGAYAHVRRLLNQGTTPPADAVRVEEMINYFRYDLPAPTDRAQPFSITTDLATTPWSRRTHLLRIGLRGYDVARAERPAANIVFVVDVSGSMEADNKLPLVKATLAMFADQLRSDDRVSLVTYGDIARLALGPGNDRAALLAAIEPLKAFGFTAGGEALAIAYGVAQSAFIQGGINRIILATDGDFNLGLSDPEQLKAYVERAREDGVTLTTLGFGDGAYSDAMMETLADAGNGAYAYIDGLSEARKVVVDELSSTLFTIAQDVKVQVAFNPDQVTTYRLIGYENRQLPQAASANDKVDAGDISAGHQVTALYEIELASAKQLPHGQEAGGPRELATVDLRYKLPGETVSKIIRKQITVPRETPIGPPQGDFAFAAAVAAFGQALRREKDLGDFDRHDIVRLAGPQSDLRRQEFLRLVALPAAASPR